jgi:GNAT superfamily N-acetyltransferase
MGLYVVPEFRNQGYGLQLLSAAIERCIERGLPTPIRITAISANVRGLYNRFPEHLRNNVNFIDTSMGLNL